MAAPLVKLTPDVLQQQRELASELMLVKTRLLNAGLLMTFQSLEHSTRVIGYEMAALLEGTWPDSVMAAMERSSPHAS